MDFPNYMGNGFPKIFPKIIVPITQRFISISKQWLENQSPLAVRYLTYQ